MGRCPSPAKRRWPGRSPDPLSKTEVTHLNKDTTFSIRISSQDLETIRQKAQQAHLSQSDYVTRCCLGKQIIVLDEGKDLLRALRAIGNNLNQQTVLANMGRVTVLNQDRTADELAEVSALLRALLERGR